MDVKPNYSITFILMKIKLVWLIKKLYKAISLYTTPLHILIILFLIFTFSHFHILSSFFSFPFSVSEHMPTFIYNSEKKKI